MEVVTMAGRGSSGEVRELPAGCARACGAAAPGPRRVLARAVQAERDPGAPVRVDVVVGDVGGAAGGDDDACVAGKSTVRSGGCEAWGAPCEQSVPGPWLRYTRLADSVAVVPTWRGKEEGRGERARCLGL